MVIQTKREMLKAEAGGLVSDITRGMATVAGGLTVLWVASIVNWAVFAGGLSTYAIQPWTLGGLAGIAIAPFLHGGVMHLLMNSITFAILAPMMMLRNRMDFWVVSVFGALASGLAAWTLGGLGTVHLGFSGVLFAYLGFLMTRGIWERSITTIALSVGITWLFGGMVWGIFPIIAGAGISWQAHLGGFVGGVLAARVLGNAITEKRGS